MSGSAAVSVSVMLCSSISEGASMAEERHTRDSRDYGWDGGREGYVLGTSYG